MIQVYVQNNDTKMVSYNKKKKNTYLNLKDVKTIL